MFLIFISTPFKLDLLRARMTVKFGIVEIYTHMLRKFMYNMCYKYTKFQIELFGT